MGTAKAERRKITDRVQTEHREHLTTEEEADFRRLTEDVDAFQDRLDELTDEADREQQIVAGHRSARPGGGVRLESRGGSIYSEFSGNSYFADSIRAASGEYGAGTASASTPPNAETSIGPTAAPGHSCRRRG